MRRALLDSDIWSEIARDRNPTVTARARAYVQEHGRYTVSVVTVMEAVRGYSRIGREDKIERLLKLFARAEVLPLDERSAELAGRIRADLERMGLRVDLADLLVASIALRHDVPVVTGNHAHFDRVRDAGYRFTIENWRDPAPEG
jgi:tRNA(fMet)-specific endonuclease VapC